MITLKGTIAGISGHPMSGLWTLHFQNGDSCYIESGFGVRQLAACFGATEFKKGDLFEKIKDQEIIYSVDDFNVLYGFTPSDEWEGPEIPEEGIEEDEFDVLYNEEED